MQLCIYINCFIKTHNKQLNQYCLNFTIFLPKKESFKKMVWVWVGSRVGSGHGSTRFCFGSKMNSGRVFFGSGRVGLEKFWAVLPCLPTFERFCSSSKLLCERFLIMRINIYSNIHFLRHLQLENNQFNHILNFIWTNLLLKKIILRCLYNFVLKKIKVKVMIYELKKKKKN